MGIRWLTTASLLLIACNPKQSTTTETGSNDGSEQSGTESESGGPVFPDDLSPWMGTWTDPPEAVDQMICSSSPDVYRSVSLHADGTGLFHGEGCGPFVYEPISEPFVWTPDAEAGIISFDFGDSELAGPGRPWGDMWVEPKEPCEGLTWTIGGSTGEPREVELQRMALELHTCQWSGDATTCSYFEEIEQDSCEP